VKWLKNRYRQTNTVFSFLILVIFILAYMPLSLSLRKITLACLRFPQEFISTRAWDLKQLLRYRYLERENAQLKNLVSSFQQKILQLEEAAQENQRLRELLSFSEKPSYQLVTASVIGRDISNWENTLFINRGTKQGIKVDKAVINPDGLVGKIVEANASTSKVLLITDPDSRVSAILAKSRAQGLVVGSPAGFVLRCYMKYVSLDALVEPGEQVLTAGLGSVYPKGILIGTVVKIEKNPQSLYQTVWVKPAFSPDRLEEVLVIKNASQD
jgi:rod shape-determining protein MreC